MRNMKPNNSTKIDHWFGLGSFPRSFQKISHLYLVILIIHSIAFHIVDTFVTLYLLDKISWIQVGLVFSIQLGAQVIFDFPTGAIGDWIGQKWILISAFVMKICAIFFLLSGSKFIWLVIYAILTGLANSQESGALDSWYDSNYMQTASGQDPGRKNYGIFQGRIYMIYVGLAGITSFASGVLSTQFSRDLLFWIQGVLLGLLLTIILIRFPTSKSESKEDLLNDTSSSQKQSYWQVIAESLRFSFSKGYVFLFLIGVALFSAAVNNVWTNLLLFPIYKDYAITDSMTGTIRLINLTSDIFLIGVLTKIVSKVKRIRLGYLLSLVGIIGGIFCIGLYYFWFSPLQIFQIGRFVGLIAIGFVLGIPYRVNFLFYAKIMIDFIPDRIRNSLYSLIPTLTLIIGIPLSTWGGNIVEEAGKIMAIGLVIIVCSIGVIFQAVGFRLSPKKKKIRENS